mgnify:CR=1 FL=1
MPYIKREDRERLSFHWDADETIKTPGELNYLLTEMILGYLDDKGLSYQTINDIVGALEGAKLEFYRRIAVPYEDKKIQENGDVY